jgi:hypothetical protein
MVVSPRVLALVGLAAPELLERLQRRFASFVFLLTNDTTGVEERARLVPFLLGAWILASLVAGPASHLTARLLGSSAEMRRSAGTAIGIGALQAAFFALHWGVIAWGRRSLDWSVFGMSVLACALVSKWAHEIDFARCLLHVLLQSATVLLLLFLAAFGLSELGWIAF